MTAARSLFATSLVLLATLLAPVPVGAADLRVEVVPTIGHAQDVDAVAFSADGRRLVSTSHESAKLWDVPTGRLVRTFVPDKAHAADWIVAGALAPDGATIAAGEGNAVVVWDAATGDPRHILDGHADRVASVAFSQDGLTLASGGDDRRIVVWDLASGAALRRLDVGGQVAAVAFSPDGRTLAAATPSGVQVRDAASGAVLRTLAGLSGARSLRFSADGRSLAAAGDKAVAIWDVATGRLARRLDESTLKADVFGAGLTGDMRLLASRGADPSSGEVDLFDAAGGRLVHALKGAGMALATAFSPDGKALAVGTDAKTVVLWDVATGAHVRTFEANSDRLTAVALTPDDRSLATASFEGAIRLFDLDSGALIRTVEERSVNPVTGGYPVVFSPDGRLLLSRAADGAIKLWDRTTGRVTQALKAEVADECGALAFGPRGDTVAVSSSSKNEGAVELWDPKTGRRLGRLPQPPGGTCAVRFSPDGHTLAYVGTDNTIRLWDTVKRTLARTLKEKLDVATLAFSPDGRTLAAGLQGGTFRFWDAGTGRIARTLAGPAGGQDMIPAGPLAYSPDGKRVALGRGEKIDVVDAATGAKVWTLAGRPTAISALAFTSDGRRLISASDEEGVVNIWNAQDGELLAMLFVFPEGGWLAMTPEGFFDGSEEGKARLSIVQGLEVTSTEQFYQALHRPDLLRAKLAGDPDGLVREAAGKLDLAKVLASGFAPRVSITSPAEGGTVVDATVTLAATVEDHGGGIGRVEWRVNGVTQGLSERGLAPVRDGKSMEVRRTLALEPGDSTIEITAYNADGLIASTPATLRLTRTAPTSSEGPRLQVLAIGINDYFDSRLRLSFAAPDAKSLADTLQTARGSLYDSVEVKLLTDAQATTERIEKAFDDLARTVRPQDVFVFYLAGHGKTMDGRYYFIPQEFRYTGEESLAQHGISQDRWQELLARIPARRSVLLFDSCESGSLVGEHLQQRGLERVVAIDRLTRAMGRTTLTAATDDAPALEGYKGHGVFTYALLEALSQADVNHDGAIDVVELAGFIDREVPEISARVFKARQIPQMKIVGSNFVVSSRVDAAPAGAEAEGGTGVPTHVVIAPAEVRAAPGDGGAVARLTPGTQVELLRDDGAWLLIGRAGKKLGYVEASVLAKLQ